MRYILALLAVFAMLAGPAHAGWNIKQNDDGSTVWIDNKGNTVPVGDSGLIVPVSNFAHAITHYVVTHKTGRIKKVYATSEAFNSGSNATIITLFVANSPDGANFTQITPFGSAAGSLTMVTAAGGVASATLSGTELPSPITAGSALAVRLDGGGTCTGVSCHGVVTIVIE